MNNTAITVDRLNRELVMRLTPKLGHGEAVAAVRIIWEDVMQYTPAQIIVRGDHELEPATVRTLRDIVERVEQGTPVQYAVGRANFMGMSLRVDGNTLIPRPETAQLVDMIVESCGNERDLRVLDIGTGSGCIAIALARALKFADVTAVDISEGALNVAAANARDLKAKVRFVRTDALRLADAPRSDSSSVYGSRDALTPPYDIIVSNPPYVLASEGAGMAGHVLRHEPHTALFVPDDDPLRFYTAIAAYARTALKPGGRLYFELNPLTAEPLRDMLAADGWREVELHRDFYNRLRFLTARL